MFCYARFWEEQTTRPKYSGVKKMPGKIAVNVNPLEDWCEAIPRLPRCRPKFAAFRSRLVARPSLAVRAILPEHASLSRALAHPGCVARGTGGGSGRCPGAERHAAAPARPAAHTRRHSRRDAGRHVFAHRVAMSAVLCLLGTWTGGARWRCLIKPSSFEPAGCAPAIQRELESAGSYLPASSGRRAVGTRQEYRGCSTSRFFKLDQPDAG